MNEPKEYAKIRTLAEQYDIGAILYMAPLSSGSSSHAWRIDSEKGSWILRKCHRIMSAADEYAISEALFNTDITPVVILTKDGERFVVNEDGVYNLQTRTAGEPVSVIDETLMKKAAEALVTVHRVLKEAKIHLHGDDRYSLHNLSWEDIQKAWAYPGTFDILKDLNDVYDLESQRDECIHGDAGIWNFLVCDPEVRLIDFGEARMGNSYFDHAGFLVSALERKDAQTAASLMKTYLEAAEKAGCPLNPSILARAVKLWLLRGLFASFAFENNHTLIEQAVKTDQLFRQVFRLL